MRLSSWLAASAALASASVSAIPTSSLLRTREDGLEAARTEVERRVAEIVQKKMAELKEREGGSSNCTAANVGIRREYGDLSKEERADYVRAVKCIMELPARTPHDVAPGARSRYDDFTVVHIQQTLRIHFTGNFLAWHRWFVYSYEKALREECGYKGFQPYWDWAKYAAAPQDSPIFNGDEYSLGGNGEWIGPHEGPVLNIPTKGDSPPLRLAGGLGGGVVTKGPFSGRTVLLGPAQQLDDNTPAGPMGGLGENPRPWRRDVGPAVNMRYANHTTVRDMLRATDIDSFRYVGEGVKDTEEIGPHGGGHYAIAGDPGGDVFTSPGDPAFYTHHGMMDRMWALWQELDPETRRKDMGTGIYAHETWYNDPPTNITSLDEVIDMGYAGDKITIREVMDTTSGLLCYFYL